VHKLFIVPVSKIAGIEGNKLLLKNSNTEVIIGESYKSALMEIIRNKIIN